MAMSTTTDRIRYSIQPWERELILGTWKILDGRRYYVDLESGSRLDRLINDLLCYLPEVQFTEGPIQHFRGWDFEVKREPPKRPLIFAIRQAENMSDDVLYLRLKLERQHADNADNE
jgi:hypothetical protein